MCHWRAIRTKVWDGRISSPLPACEDLCQGPRGLGLQDVAEVQEGRQAKSHHPVKLFSSFILSETPRDTRKHSEFYVSSICKLSLTWLFPLIYSCWQEISWSGQPCDTTPVHPAPPVIPVVSTDIIACPNYAFTLEHTDHNLFSNRMKIYNLYKLRFI